MNGHDLYIDHKPTAINNISDVVFTLNNVMDLIHPSRGKMERSALYK